MGGAGRSARSRWLLVLVAVPAVWHIGAVVWIVAQRLTYPMDLEWMEGGQLYEAHRLMHGQPVFGSPDQGYVPFAYPPLHPTVLAGFGRVVGLDYWSGRLVSVVCVVVAAAVLYRQVERHGGGTFLARLVGLLGVGLAAAGFPVTGGWYDLVRNDSLALVLPVAAAGLVSDGDRLVARRRWITVAALLVAGVYTKQTDVLFAAWICAFMLATDRSLGVRLAAMTAGLGLVTFVVLQLATDGWMLTWMRAMASHDIQWHRIDRIARAVRVAPYVVALPVVAGVLVRRRWLSRRGALWLGMLAAAFPAGVLPLLKFGGYVNNLMPIVFLAGPVSLLLAMDLWRGLAEAGRARWSQAVRASTLAGAAALLVVLGYGLDRYVPDAEHRRDAQALNELVRSLDGEVLVLHSPFLAVRNGQPGPQVHAMAHTDAVMADIPHAELERFVAASDAEWVLADGRYDGTIRRAGCFSEGSRRVVTVHPVTGLRTAPQYLYHRVEPAGAACAHLSS